MKAGTLFWIFLACAIAMVFAATPWLLPVVAVPLGSGAFAAFVLSTAAFALRVAKRRGQIAGGFFLVGLALLVIAVPSYRPIVSLFEPAVRSASYPEIPADIVFGILAVGCIFRSWFLWTVDEKKA